MAKNKRPRGGAKTAPRNKTDHNDSGAKALERGLEGIKAELEDLSNSIPDVGPMREDLEGLKADVAALAAKEAPEIPDHTEALAGIKSRLDVLDNARNSPGGTMAKTKSLGQMIHDSEGFKAFMANPKMARGYRFDVPSDVPSAGSVAAILSGVKATAPPVLGSDELGPLSWSYRRSDIVTIPKESVDAFVPLIPVVPVPGTEVYDYRKETETSATGFIRTQLKVAVNGDPTPVNTCTVDDSTHLLVGSYVRFFDDDGDLLGRHKIVTNTVATGVLTFATDALDFDAAIGDNVTSEVWGATVESGDKPYGYLAAEQVSVNLKTIAELIATTTQRLNSAPGLDSWIRRVMPERWNRNVAYQLLYGNAAAAGAPQLAGFASESGVQTYLWNSGTVGDTRADAVLRAANLVVGRNVQIVMNKRDLLSIRLAKNSSGDYIETPNFGRISLDMVGGNWVLDGYVIIESDAVIDGDFFCIDFSRASEIPDQQSASLDFGLVGDQFIRNEITVRYEATIAHAILSTAAYVYGQWNSAPS
jgi:hypothetical protein